MTWECGIITNITIGMVGLEIQQQWAPSLTYAPALEMIGWAPPLFSRTMISQNIVNTPQIYENTVFIIRS